MSKSHENTPQSIPPHPYDGHPAGSRWFVEQYQTQRAALEGLSISQLETIVGRIGEVPQTSDQQAHDQAAVDALASRSKR